MNTVQFCGLPYCFSAWQALTRFRLKPTCEDTGTVTSKHPMRRLPSRSIWIRPQPAGLGSVSIPAQNASGLTLEAISFSEGKASFQIKGAPGSPTFTGNLSADEAVLVSVDQGNAQIPVSTITQTGTKLVLKVNTVGGGYEAEINGEGTQLTSSWTQLGNTLPLTLKKTECPFLRPTRKPDEINGRPLPRRVTGQGLPVWA
jgi:hypothetical protein